MRRDLLAWLAALVLAIGIGAGVVVVMNATLLGAGGFVRIYLDAVARGDATAALGLAGVDDAGASDLLLTDSALAGLDDLQQVSDVDLGDGRHRVAYHWSSAGGSGISTFEVERVGTRFGLFPEWAFATSPVAVVDLTVDNDARFTVNDLSTATDSLDGTVVDYAVFVPGTYVFGHESTFLTADDDTVLATEVAAPIPETVEVEAAPAFTAAVETQVHDQLDSCATQTVLFPTGCPFGLTINDRVVSVPHWSIVDYPDIHITPAEEFGTWRVGPSDATAHLRVDVQSLFDGSVTGRDDDVDFTALYLARIDGTTLTLTPQF